MIELYYTHSTEEDWFYLQDYKVEIDEAGEKERVEKIIEKEIIESVEFPDWEHIAVRLGVDKKMIDIDVEEIDMF